MQIETAKPPRLKLGKREETQSTLELVAPAAPRVDGDELFPEETGWRVVEHDGRYALRGPLGECRWFATERGARLVQADVLSGGELFPDSAPAEIRVIDKASITCRVCGLPAKILITAPARICEACGSDPVLTRNSIDARLTALNGRVEVAWDAWCDALAAADELTRARWERAAAAGVEPAQAFAATWDRRTESPEPLAALLRAWEVYGAAIVEIDRLKTLEETARAELALMEV
jgi:hypothetical protein